MSSNLCHLNQAFLSPLSSVISFHHFCPYHHCLLSSPLPACPILSIIYMNIDPCPSLQCSLHLYQLAVLFSPYLLYIHSSSRIHTQDPINKAILSYRQLAYYSLAHFNHHLFSVLFCSSSS